jgi:hypothetical protein
MVEWDEDGGLVRERDQIEKAAVHATRISSPPPADLNIPPEAFGLKEFVPAHYTTMFWQVWKNRGLESGEIMQRWRQHLASEN